MLMPTFSVMTLLHEFYVSCLSIGVAYMQLVHVRLLKPDKYSMCMSVTLTFTSVLALNFLLQLQ